MRKLISTLTALPLLAAIFIGSLAAPCQAATPGTLAFPATLGGGDSLTVMDIILGHEDLSVFAALLDTANLDEVLIGAGPFTVFAPVNMAVDQLDPMLIISLVLDPASLAGVLGYHISESLLMSVDMTDGQSLGTLTDDELVLSVGDASIMVNNYATIVEADLVGSNGVVHVIDQVLFPEQSVDDLSAATFAAYPNPIQNELWIASTSGQTLQIHDATGRLIESINMPISGGRTLISTQDWAPGVMLISDDKGHVIRLVND